MKKLFAILTVIVVSTSMFSCSNETQPEVTNTFIDPYESFEFPNTLVRSWTWRMYTDMPNIQNQVESRISSGKLHSKEITDFFGERALPEISGDGILPMRFSTPECVESTGNKSSLEFAIEDPENGDILYVGIWCEYDKHWFGTFRVTGERMGSDWSHKEMLDPAETLVLLEKAYRSNRKGLGLPDEHV